MAEFIEVSEENKKGYRLIIEKLDTGERLVDVKTRAIIGAVQDEEGCQVKEVVVTSCDLLAYLATIQGAEKAVNDAKKSTGKEDLLFALLKLIQSDKE